MTALKTERRPNAAGMARFATDWELDRKGATATSVEVATETPLLTTESASSGTVIDRRQVTELPLPYGPTSA